MAVRSRLPLFNTNSSGRIVDWNRAAEELSGFAARDAVGRGCGSTCFFAWSCSW